MHLSSRLLQLYCRWLIFQVCGTEGTLCTSLVYEGTLCTSPAAPRQRSGAALVWLSQVCGTEGTLCTSLVYEGTLCTSPAVPRQRSGAALVWLRSHQESVRSYQWLSGIRYSFRISGSPGARLARMRFSSTHDKVYDECLYCHVECLFLD